MTPGQLAAELGMSPKTLRGWLRRDFPRENRSKNTLWELTPEMVRAARARFGVGGRRPSRQPECSPGRSSRSNPDRIAGRTGGGLHRPLLVLAKEAGIELGQGRPVAGLTTRGHLLDHRTFGVPAETVAALRRIFDALAGEESVIAIKPWRPIAPDLVHLPSGTLVEVDEVQHFTSARLTSLRLYPRGAQLGFDIDEYVALAEQWRDRGDRAFAHRTAPEFAGLCGRQRQRAYLDAARDLIAPFLVGRPVIRIPVPDRSLVTAVEVLRRRLPC